MATKGGPIDFMFLGPLYPAAGSDAVGFIHTKRSPVRRRCVMCVIQCRLLTPGLSYNEFDYNEHLTTKRIFPSIKIINSNIKSSVITSTYIQQFLCIIL